MNTDVITLGIQSSASNRMLLAVAWTDIIMSELQLKLNFPA